MHEKLSGSSTVMIAQDQVSSDLGEEVVILDLRSGKYYGLNNTAATVWNLIQQPQPVDSIRDAILSEYEVDAERCERELHVLLENMQAEGLIEIRNESVV